MKRLVFEGMMAPTFAPFRGDGSLNTSVIRRYAAHLKKHGVKGVFVNGTVGEGMNMTVEERKELAKAWLDCKHDIPTNIIQCGALCTKEVIDMAKHAEENGASGVCVLPPIYDKPTNTDSLIQYIEEVSKACPNTPILYYHFPLKTDVRLSMSEFLKKGVSRVPTLSGIKFTDPDVSGEGKECLKVDNGSLSIFLGYDQTLQEGLSVGFKSGINLSYNFLPDLASSIFTLMSKGKEKEAKMKQRILDDYFDIVMERKNEKRTNLTPSFKTTFSLLTGIELGPTRFPATPLTQDELENLKDGLRMIGYNV